MSSTTPGRDIRPNAKAGEWYPGNPRQLAESIDAFIAQADAPVVPGRVVGILAPHAGHRYSGAVAGYAFRRVQDLDIDVVALAGPSHQPYHDPIITTAHEAYETPLGEITVDQNILDTLRQSVPIRAIRRDQEHSLEIELPFLQRALKKEFRLVPLALVDHSLALAKQLGHALADALAGQKALLVASSDLSHYYPQSLANQLDQTVLDAIAAFDPAAVIRAEERGTGFACGRGAIATIMIAAQALGADAALILKYATSGDVNGNYQQVVGYGAGAFYQASSTG